MQKFFLTELILLIFYSSCFPQVIQPEDNVTTGAERTEQYVNYLKNKNIALCVNQTSVLGNKNLIDTLLHYHLTIKKIFAPEHGFRGKGDAGENILNTIDSATKIPVISLYGNHLKPQPADLNDLDVIVYDIQDVGVRCYTYISTLHYLMESCAENNIELFILDRPDPNGFYVDGPVLDTAFRSFVGLDPVPLVYGMTTAEYALMLNGERWLSNGEQCKLRYVTCGGYDHNMMYSLPVTPSPNLRDMTAIYLYPSLCFFEGTTVSVGRGTDKPFKVIGFPLFKGGNVVFTPVSMAGAKNPPYLNVKCHGKDLSGLNTGFFFENKKILLQWLMTMYEATPGKDKFFIPFFDKLAGTDKLRIQIEKGVAEMEIRRSWEPGLSQYKVTRKKYLLYPDFD
ncbi:MAG: DUF1343 domain-containing protein [Chitinophagales bacterium]|nr:DUF1343 domain-containing protein [Chitinophagales bacterium]